MIRTLAIFGAIIIASYDACLQLRRVLGGVRATLGGECGSLGRVGARTAGRVSDGRE
jgi:hypothetical protein